MAVSFIDSNYHQLTTSHRQALQHHSHQSLPPPYHKSQTGLTTPQAPIITTNLPQVTDKPYNTTGTAHYHQLTTSHRQALQHHRHKSLPPT